MDNESDVEDDEFNDNLDKNYDSDDPNAAQRDSSDDEDSSDSDGDVQIDIQRPFRKILTKKQSLDDKSLDENCYDPHDFGVAEDLAREKFFFVQRKTPIPRKSFGQTKSRSMPTIKEHAMSCHVLLNHRQFFILLLVSIPLTMHLKFYLQIKWFN